jgi:acetyl esterase/lipase
VWTLKLLCIIRMSLRTSPIGELFRSLNQSSWSSGFLTGVALTASSGILLQSFSLYNGRLSFFMNITNLLDRLMGFMGLGLSNLPNLRESDLYSINKSRRIQNLIPLGPIREVKSVQHENVPSKYGHSIPIQIFTPPNHQSKNPLIIYYHGGFGE